MIAENHADIRAKLRELEARLEGQSAQPSSAIGPPWPDDQADYLLRQFGWRAAHRAVHRQQRPVAIPAQRKALGVDRPRSQRAGIKTCGI